MRNPAHGKGYKKGGLAYAKVGSSLRGPPGFSRASTTKTRVCLLYCVMLSTYSSDINRRLSPHHLFLEKVIQSFQIISLLGIIRVFQSKNPSDGFLACLLDSYSCACDCLWPPDPQEAQEATSQECRGFRGVKIIRIGLLRVSFVEPILAAKFSYLLFVDIVGIYNKQVVDLVLATLDL